MAWSDQTKRFGVKGSLIVFDSTKRFPDGCSYELGPFEIYKLFLWGVTLHYVLHYMYYMELG